MATAAFDPIAVEAQLRAWLAGLQAGAPQTVGALTLFGLLHPQAEAAGAVLAHEALTSGLLEVLEKDGGVVQELLARNTGEREVILVEGETMVGARQNRVVAHTVVVAGRSDVVVPVGCMEQGRWRFTSDKFAAGATPSDWKLRRTIKSDVLRMRSATGRAALDQKALWSQVADELDGEAVASDTSDYHELIRRRRGLAEDVTRHLRVVEGQVGLLALADGHFVGMEAVGSADTWRRLSPRVLPSLVPAATDPALRRKRPAGHARSEVEWLQAIAAARVQVRSATGLGADVEFVMPAAVGSGVWLDGRPAHLSVFAPA